MSRPNFLFITTDQQRWDALGLHNSVLKTPNMDRLANEGIQFGRAYPTNAICMPCLLYTSPSPRDGLLSRMPSSA